MHGEDKRLVDNVLTSDKKNGDRGDGEDDGGVEDCPTEYLRYSLRQS